MQDVFQSGAEPYYEIPQQSYKKDNVQPTEYEEFQPSVSLMTQSNLPLLNKEPQEYEVVGGLEGTAEESEHSNGVYETVRDPSIKTTPQCYHNDQANNSESTDNHVYFSLEPHHQAQT